MKRFLLISALLLCAFSLKAQDTKAPAFKFGVEWGENTLLWYAYHFNYTTDIGSRVDQQDSRFKAAFNGSVMGFVGVNASDWLSVAFYGGFAGYDRGLRMIPALVRTTWYPRGACSDGVMAFMDLGTDVKTIIQENTVIADLGTGYRFSLSRHIEESVLSFAYRKFLVYINVQLRLRLSHTYTRVSGGEKPPHIYRAEAYAGIRLIVLALSFASSICRKDGSRCRSVPLRSYRPSPRIFSAFSWTSGP